MARAMGCPNTLELLPCTVQYHSEIFEKLTFFKARVWVIIWGQQGYPSTHGDPCCGSYTHMGRATGPLEPS